MAVPKQKVSKQRRNKRTAAAWTISRPSFCECPQCHELRRAHAVCPNCGYYDGEKKVAVKADENK